MKDLGETKYYIGIQIEHLQSRILLHQSNYAEKILKSFSMDKENILSTPMIGKSLNVKKNPFHLREGNEEIFGHEVTYLSAIESLIHLANCTRLDIAFATNLLVRVSSSLTQRH